MKRFALSFLFALFTLVSVNVSATNVWTGYKNVSEVQVVEDGSFVLYFSSPIGSPCSPLLETTHCMSTLGAISSQQMARKRCWLQRFPLLQPG